MTDKDTDYARWSASGVIDARQAMEKADIPTQTLQYTKLADDVHDGLMHRFPLLSRLAGDAERIRRLIRPPFGHVAQLSADGDKSKLPPGSREFRDPRVERHTQHDMRMPPYMLDSDANPLSLTWRQYHLLMALVDRLAVPPPPPGGPASDAAPAHGAAMTPAARLPQAPTQPVAAARIGVFDHVLKQRKP
jgi:hypothetical protein